MPSAKLFRCRGDWPDWPLAGFSPWAGPAGQQVDERVEAFVESGDPPVLVCIGRMRERQIGRLVSMLRNLGAAGIPTAPVPPSAEPAPDPYRRRTRERPAPSVTRPR